MPTTRKSKQTPKPAVIPTTPTKTTGLDDNSIGSFDEDLWDEILEPTDAWNQVEEELIENASPFVADDVFKDDNESVHNQAASGQRLMSIKDKQVASPRDWFNLFTTAFNKNTQFYSKATAQNVRKFAVKLGISAPKLVFDNNLWKDNRLQENLVTNPWIGAYKFFGAKWRSGGTFDQYILDTSTDMDIEQEAETEDIPASNVAFLNLLLETPTRQAAQFNIYNREFITFVKFKTPQFEGDERRQREVEFIAAMKEMLETVWESDPSAILIPWDAESKAKGLKKSTTKFPNTSDGWRLYVDRVFLKKDARCWPRMRLAHNLHSSFLEEKDLVEAFKNNDSYLTKEAIQVYESVKVGWFLGSQVNAFNTETMRMSLNQQQGLKKIPIHLKVEYIRLDLKTPGKTKAVHIYTAKDKAFACREALIKIYSQNNADNYPLGKNMRFIPDITDTRFISSLKTKHRVKKCEAKQKSFMQSSDTSRNFTILGLDYHHPKLGLTLRQAIMGLRAVSDNNRNLFMAVDKQVTSNIVIFAYHKELASEALTAVAALPVILEARYGVHIWTWFTDEARDTARGYEWDEDEGIIEKRTDINLEWDGPDEDDDEPEDVVIEGGAWFNIDIHKRGRSELMDGGSTVGSFRSTLQKRKYNEASSVASSLTTSTTADIERFKHLLNTDPVYRSQVLNLTGSIKQSNHSSTQADDVTMSTAARSSGAERKSWAQLSLSGENIDEHDGEEFGDAMTKKAERTLRIVFQNVGSLSESKTTNKSNQFGEFVIHNEVDVMMMAEVGLRWDKIPVEDQWSERVFGKFEKEKNVFSYNRNDGDSKTAAQYGGTGISVVNDPIHRIIEKGCDPSGLGRWSWIRMRGKHDTTVRLIAAYQPCNSHGPLLVASQHRRYLQSQSCFTHPRVKMMEDLRSECRKWTEQGDLLIIGIDVNDDTRSKTVQEFCDSLGLVDAVLERHKDKSPPATYNRNTQRKPIDAIWVSASLVPSASGFMAFDCGLLSDHRAIWIDVPYTEVFGYAYPPMNCGSRRKLNTKDPRLVTKYCQRVTQKLQQEGIPERMRQIEQDAERFGWNHQLEDEFNYLHRRNIEIRRKIEQNLRKFRAGAVPWSPKLQSYRDNILLWSLIKKKRLGVKTSSKKIKRVMKKVNKHEALTVSLEEASQLLDQAFRDYKIAKSKAPMWRDDFLHNLAAARAKAKGTNKQGELKALTQVRKQKKQAAGIKRVRNKIQDLACFKIQVGDGDDIQTIDNKIDIEKAFIDANVRKFSQTKGTPPMQESMKSLIGEYGETKVAQDILNGSFTPDERLDSLMAELLLTMKRPQEATDALPPNCGISTEVHCEGWKRQKESTSAEPTGLSFSHYKAACQEETLAEMDAIFRSLPFKYGFSPEAWLTITDVQILKKAGIYHVDKMRTIMLMHAEFNMNNKLIGKTMMEFAEAFYLLAVEQFGSRKHHQATSAALNKKLTFDILRQKRLAGAICANDAKSCYDRIVHNIAAICMMRAGAPKEAVWSMFRTLKKSIHHIKTAFGVSNSSYTSTESAELQGIGQGNGCGPAAWAAISTPIIQLMKRKGHGLKLASALSNIITEFVAYAFVDDTDLVTSANNILEDAIDTMEGLQALATDWDDALFLTGGAVVPEKSHWTMVAFKWKNDKWHYQRSAELPGEILLKDPITRVPKPIKRLEPDESEETLGVFISGDGNNKKQVEKLRKKSQVFGQCIKSGRISKYDTNFALRSTVMKTLSYPTLVTNINESQWGKILSPAIRASLPRMGFVRTLPSAIVHGPMAMGGLEIPHLFHVQHLSQLQYVLEEVNSNSIAKNLIITTAEQFILEAGLDSKYLDWSMRKVMKYTTDGWWKSLIKYCYDHQFELCTDIKSPSPVSENDTWIMKEVLKLSWKPGELRIINECRMALRATLLSDITMADGKTISRQAWEGIITEQEERYSWPKRASLTQRHWRLWRKALHDTVLVTNTHVHELRVPLQNRNFPLLQAQVRQFWVYSRRQNKLFLRENERWVIFLPTATRRQLRRSSYTRTDYFTCTLPPSSEYASVEGDVHMEVVTLKHTQSFLVQQEATVNPATIEDYLEEIYDQDKWLWEEIEGLEHADELASAITDRTLMAISDGSYMNGFGTSASVICNNSDKEIWLQSITPGDTKYQHSQRSKLAGIAASVAMIQAICKTFQISSGAVTIGLDGQQAIQNLQRDKPRIKFSDYDLIRFIRYKISALPIDVTFLWIKGHQDELTTWNNLDYPARMNVRADRKARQFLTTHMRYVVPNPSVHFSTESWWLTQNNVKFSNVHGDKIYEQVMQDKLLRYWMEKGNIDEELSNEIDWVNFGVAFSKCTFAQRRRIVKLSSGHAPVSKMMFRWKKQDHIRCPLCDFEGEDVHHMLTCPHTEATTTWIVSIEILRESLTDIHTDPTLISMIQFGLRQWKNPTLATPSSLLREMSWKMKQCFAHQTCIGWENLVHGRLSIWWELCQAEYYSRSGSPYHSASWTQKFIKLLWGLMWKAWDTRNYSKHHTLTTARQNEINDLHQKITTQFQLGCQGITTDDHTLFDLSMDDLLECSWDYKTRWLQSVIAARQRHQHQTQTEHSNLNHSRELLRNWLNT